MWCKWLSRCRRSWPLALLLAMTPAPASALGFPEISCAEPVATSEGPVAGATAAGGMVCAYRGIPYAAPPVGELRFRPPQPALAHEQVLRADDFGPWCVQPVVRGIYDRYSSRFPISEDCLTLNIWRPARRGIFPVLFWIHGGGLENGGAALGMYDGGRLADAVEVVVVSINYRLGVFGFLAHPELSAEDPHHSSGNYGLLDQLAALQWVQKNIAAFGGDPGKVTVFGNSAGGWSVCNLLVSPLAAGLFHRAVIQSGGCDAAISLAAGEAEGVELARGLNCLEPGAAACLRSKSLSELLSLPVSATQAKNLTDVKALLTYGWRPKEDGWVLLETPIDALRAGRFHRVPLLVGSNRDEGKVFTFDIPGARLIPVPLIRWVLRQNFGATTLAEMEKLYPFSAYPRPMDAVIYALGDATLACKCYDAAEALAGSVPVYYYRFDYDRNRAPHMFGAAHGAEIPFVFNTLDQPPEKIFYSRGLRRQAEPLSQAMMRYWANFAHQGDPNGPGLLPWPAYEPEQRQRMYLDWPLTVRADEDRAKCEFWQGQGISLK